MEEILTAEEIENLIASLAVTGSRGEEETSKPRELKVRVYDFKRPDKFSKEQIRTLKLVHENLARLLTTAFSAHLRTTVQASLVAIEQMAYQQYSDSVVDPAILGVIDLGPLDGNALVEITPEIALPMIDRLFGGPGKAKGSRRALTDIEEVVMRKVFNSFLGVLAESWQNIVRLEPELESIESNPLFTQLVAPNEIVLEVILRTVLGDHQGYINICLPYLVLEPILPRLSARQWFASEHTRGSDEESRVANRIGQVPLNLRVELGRTRLSVRDFIQLAPGDVVTLEQGVERALTVFVENRPKFRATAGRVKRKLAVKIADVLWEGGD